MWFRKQSVVALRIVKFGILFTKLDFTLLPTEKLVKRALLLVKIFGSRKDYTIKSTSLQTMSDQENTWNITVMSLQKNFI